MVAKRVKDIHEQKIILISIAASKMKSQKWKCEKDVCTRSTCFFHKNCHSVNRQWYYQIQSQL